MNEKTRSLSEMDAAHRRVGRYVSIALIVGEAQHWIYLKTILRGLLTPRERAALAFAAMRSLSKDNRLKVAINAIPEWAEFGSPLPTFLDVADDARWWAANASPKEIDAYLLACFNALQRHRQIEFGQYIQTRIAA
jgi:hypothetical protein